MSLGGMQKGFAQNANALVQHWIGTRKQVSLWLNLATENDLEALEIIDQLKRKRLFRRSVMIGLKIVWELGQGDVTTLVKEYPNIKDWLEVKSHTPPDSGQLERKIDRLEKLILEQGNAIPPMRPNEVAMQSTGAGLRKLDAPTFALPVFDDEDDELPTLKLSTSSDASKSFLRGLSGLH